MTSQAWFERAALLHAMVTHRPPGISPAVAISIATQADDLQSAWLELHGQLSIETPELATSRSTVARWIESGVQCISILDEDYPSRLRVVHDAPPFLFYRGRLSALENGGISVVGSRDVSPAGQLRAEASAQYLASESITVISGLARGVDTIAHQTTLAAGGTCAGVIATSIQGPYTPAANRDLHEQVAATGVLISQFPPGHTTQKASFVQRNATMSGLGDATFIVEASEHSGTRTQARAAVQHGRTTLLSLAVASTTSWGQEYSSTYPSVFVAENEESFKRLITQARKNE